MTIGIFGPALAYDNASKRGVAGVICKVLDAVTGIPLDALNLDGSEAPVVTNSQGYVPEFALDPAPVLVIVEAGAIRMPMLNLSMVMDASVAAIQAAQAAQDAAALVDAPADVVVATLVGSTSQTKTKLDATYIGVGAVPSIGSTNLIFDQLNQRDDAWGGWTAGPGTGWSTEQVYPPAVRSQKLTPKNLGSNMASYAAVPVPRIPVTPGEWVKASSMVFSDGIDSTMTTVGQRIYFYNAAGALMSGPGNSDGGTVQAAQWAANTWTRVGDLPVLVPNGAVSMAPRLTVYRPANIPASSTNFFVGPVVVTAAVPVATSSVDGLMPALDRAVLASATSLDTPNTVLRRDGNGRAQVSLPSSAKDAANRGYVDTALAFKADSAAVPTLDELSFSVTINPGDAISHYLFAAPFPLRIAHVSLMGDISYTASEANYIQVELFRTRAGAQATMGAKKTTKTVGGEPMVTSTPWTFDNVSFTEERRNLQTFDGLKLQINKFGSIVYPASMLVTVRYQPL